MYGQTFPATVLAGQRLVFDAVRLIGALTLPALLFAVLVETDAPAWPVFTILAFELSVGGLDNLLSHHKKATKALAWGSRVLGVSALLGAATGAFVISWMIRNRAIGACVVG